MFSVFILQKCHLVNHGCLTISLKHSDNSTLTCDKAFSPSKLLLSEYFFLSFFFEQVYLQKIFNLNDIQYLYVLL